MRDTVQICNVHFYGRSSQSAWVIHLCYLNACTDGLSSKVALQHRAILHVFTCARMNCSFGDHVRMAPCYFSGALCILYMTLTKLLSSTKNVVYRFQKPFYDFYMWGIAFYVLLIRLMFFQINFFLFWVVLWAAAALPTAAAQSLSYPAAPISRRGHWQQL